MHHTKTNPISNPRVKHEPYCLYRPIKGKHSISKSYSLLLHLQHKGILLNHFRHPLKSFLIISLIIYIIKLSIKPIHYLAINEYPKTKLKITESRPNRTKDSCALFTLGLCAYCKDLERKKPAKIQKSLQNWEPQRVSLHTPKNHT